MVRPRVVEKVLKDMGLTARYRRDRNSGLCARRISDVFDLESGDLEWGCPSSLKDGRLADDRGEIRMRLDSAGL